MSISLLCCLTGRRIGQSGRRRATTKLQRAYPGRQVRQNADAEAYAGDTLHIRMQALTVNQCDDQVGGVIA